MLWPDSLVSEYASWLVGSDFHFLFLLVCLLILLIAQSWGAKCARPTQEKESHHVLFCQMSQVKTQNVQITWNSFVKLLLCKLNKGELKNNNINTHWKTLSWNSVFQINTWSWLRLVSQSQIHFFVLTFGKFGFKPL